MYMVPFCIKENNPCELHSSGKYLKWKCGNKYDPAKRRKLFESQKKKCLLCNNVCNRYAKLCVQCSGKKTAQNRVGKPLSKEWRDNISKANSGEKSYLWKGNKAGYSSIHKYIRKHFGNPQLCEQCGVAGSRPNGKWTIQWANKDGQYLRQIENWIGLCTRCHYKQEKSVTHKRISILS